MTEWASSNRQRRLNGGLTLAEQLARADLKLRSSEFVMIQVGCMADNDCDTGDKCKTFSCNRFTQTCEYSDVPCVPPDGCHTASCDPGSGQCVNANANDNDNESDKIEREIVDEFDREIDSGN